jgi:hypothetical protein
LAEGRGAERNAGWGENAICERDINSTPLFAEVDSFAEKVIHRDMRCFAGISVGSSKDDFPVTIRQSAQCITIGHLEKYSFAEAKRP